MFSLANTGEPLTIINRSGNRPSEEGAAAAADRETWLRMAFKTFLQGVMHIPCQILKQAHRTIYRVLSWNPFLEGFSRLCDVLNC